ncbi:hypothetical protein SALBM311S_11333 [Streptomyces alboniger]
MTWTTPMASIRRRSSTVDVQEGPRKRPTAQPDSVRRVKTSGRMPGSSTSVWGRYIRPVARSTGSPPAVRSPSGVLWVPSGASSISLRSRAASAASSAMRTPFTAAPPPPVAAVSARSGISRPKPSAGSFMKSLTIWVPVPTGSLAATTRPAARLLRDMAYSAGCVRLYGSMGLMPRTKLRIPAVPLMMPPPTWSPMICSSCAPSLNWSAYDGFSGAMSRAARTAVRAVSAAVFRCLRASARMSCASCISFLPGSSNVAAGLGGSDAGSRLSAGWAL